MSKIRKPLNNQNRKNREALAQEAFDRNIRKEREIGVHPKFRNNQSLQSHIVKEWEKVEKQWEKNNGN